MDTCEKNYAEKRSLKMFLTEDEVLMKVKTLVKNITSRSLALLIFAVWLDIVWSTTNRTRVSDAAAVTFSVKCLNPLKLYPLSESIFRKWFASYSFLFTAFNNNVISNGNSGCCNDTFTDVRFTSLLAKNI